MTSCTCCGGHTLRNAPVSYNNSFPKKLLLAVSVIIVIAMCLTPVDARSVEHRRRHQRRPASVAGTPKEVAMKRPKNSNAEQYRIATRKIKHKLRNTKIFFEKDRKRLNETKEYRDGMPDWLPTVNFVDIHFHDYRIPRKSGKTISERKFAYLMPKFLKTLKEYQVIFKRLQNAQLKPSADSFAKYTIVRRLILSNTLAKLYSTIAEIEENMVEVNMQIPQFDESRMKLESLKDKVDATECLKNDYIAFRGYGNLLNNWYLELRCPVNKQADKRCAAFHAKMKEKLGNKRLKNNRNIVTVTS